MALSKGQNRFFILEKPQQTGRCSTDLPGFVFEPAQSGFEDFLPAGSRSSSGPEWPPPG